MNFTINRNYVEDGKPVCPCKPDCPLRTTTCKATCGPFKEYDRARLKYDEDFKEKLIAQINVRDYAIDAIRRSKDITRRRNRK